MIKSGMEKEKYFNFRENLIFEGEFLNGKKWNGKGKEYDFSENLIFEGGKRKNKI